MARVVAGAGQVDRSSVYVPLTRGREGNYLYLTESMPGDTDTGHGGVTPTQRREGAEYARDLLVAAAVRDGADQTPHQVWGKAREDWALTRLAAGQGFEESPFSGTRMGEVMADREVRRAERFSEFFRLTQIPPKKQASPQKSSKPQAQDPTGKMPATGLLDRVGISTKSVTPAQQVSYREQAERYQQYASEHAATLEQVRAQQAQAQAQFDAVAGEKTQLELALRELEQRKRQITIESQGRGFFAKMIKRSEDERRLDRLEAALVAGRDELEKFMPGYLQVETVVSDFEVQAHKLTVQEKQARDQAQYYMGQAVMEDPVSSVGLSEALNKPSKNRSRSHSSRSQGPQYRHEHDQGLER